MEGWVFQMFLVFVILLFFYHEEANAFLGCFQIPVLHGIFQHVFFQTYGLWILDRQLGCLMLAMLELAFMNDL